MAGTRFPTGVSHVDMHSGNTDTMPNTYATAADTQFINKTAVIHCIGSEADNAERTTDFTFPAKCIVKDVYLNVLTVDATETVDVGTEGTSNDPDGLLDGVSLATAGIVKGTLLNTGQTKGLLLAVDEDGAGVLVPEPSITCGSDPVSFTCSAGTDTAVFDIIIEYVEVI